MQFILLWQSEYERNVKKQMRKEEKKMAKREREWNFPQLASIVDLNYEELRRERELVLQEAALRPILSGQKAGHTHVKPSELYPHVYDTMSDVLLSPAVLAGAKVGVERGSGGLWVCVQCVRARACVCVYACAHTCTCTSFCTILLPCTSLHSSRAFNKFSHSFSPQTRNALSYFLRQLVPFPIKVVVSQLSFSLNVPVCVRTSDQ